MKTNNQLFLFGILFAVLLISFANAAAIPPPPAGCASTSDGTAPTEPTNVQLVWNVAEKGVDISWTASTDPANIDGCAGTGVGRYDIYRDNTFLGTTSSTTFLDKTMTLTGDYTYVIVAFDNANPANPCVIDFGAVPPVCKATDLTGRTATATISVDLTPPAINITSPVQNQTFTAGASNPITISLNENGSVAYDLALEGQLTFVASSIGIASTDNINFASTLTSTNLSSVGNYTLTVYATDLAGNTNNNSITFNVVPAPVVQASSGGGSSSSSGSGSPMVYEEWSDCVNGVQTQERHPADYPNQISTITRACTSTESNSSGSSTSSTTEGDSTQGTQSSTSPITGGVIGTLTSPTAGVIIILLIAGVAYYFVSTRKPAVKSK